MGIMRPGAIAVTALLGGLAFLGGVSCGDLSAARARTIVFAAASLTESFEALEEAFEAAHPDADIDVNYAGTPRLVVQLREGAPVDVLAVADMPSMQLVEAQGRIAATPAVFARNRLAIVVERGNPRGVRGLADLARTDLLVALCGPDVPAGRYARQALDRADVLVSSVSDEPSVKAIVSKLLLGELDAGIVYATDVRSAGERVSEVEIPDDENVLAEYPIACVDAGRDPDGGASFVRFVLSDDGRRILESFGFLLP